MQSPLWGVTNVLTMVPSTGPKGNLSTMASIAVVRPDRVAVVLDNVEALILDHDEDPFILDGVERALLNLTERLLTVAVEDGTPVSLQSDVVDILLAENGIHAADFVGGAYPVSPACSAWKLRFPETCTADFDGICRCTFGAGN